MISEAITDRFSVKVAIDVVEPSTSNGESAVPEVLQLSGELDIGHADGVRHVVFKYICDTPARVVIVDVSAVTFIDCVGLETLLSAHRWLDQRDRRLVLVNISAPVQRLLAILERGGWHDPLLPSAQPHAETDSVPAV
ncbi:MAG: STAS domain-containing protein, partial [Candidatus Nanopelagicales bacterium]